MSQRSKFLEEAILIRGIEPQPDELAFIARVLAQCTLPHSDPGDVRGWGRASGNVSLTISPGQYTKSDGAVVSFGIPYGSLPRLVLGWLTAEAVRTKSRRIVLGESLTSFMQEIGVVPVSGKDRTVARLRDQMRRLFGARITASYVDGEDIATRSMEITTDTELWWESHEGSGAGSWESTVTLGERFFQFATERPVPLDVRALKALRKSPLALDLYSFLTFRVSYLRRETAISWESLAAQFGAEYSETKNFTRRAKAELRKIQSLWPELRIGTPRGRLVLKPSPTHIRKRLAE